MDGDGKDHTHDVEESTVGLDHITASEALHRPDKACYTACLAPDLDRTQMAEWDRKRKTISSLIIHPEATFKKYWDIGSVFLILYSAVTVPYFLSTGQEPDGLILVFDKIVDILFMVDILLNFFTARIVDGEDGPVIETRFGAIACLYFKGWFFPDFLSSFPFDLAFSLFLGDGEMDPEALRMAKLGRMARMLKILRMVRIKRLLSRLQYAMGLKNGVVDIVQFFLFICFAAHFNACAFYVVGNKPEPVTWSRAYCVTPPITEVEWADYFSSEAVPLVEGTEFVSNLTQIDLSGPPSLFSQIYPEYTDLAGCGCLPVTADGSDDDKCLDKETRYWSSFYWSIVTMTTVGYGDVLPQTHDERDYALYAMGLSAVIFAFAMTSICTFIININQNEVYKQSRFDELIGYMATCKVNQGFHRRAIEYFGFKTGDKSLAAFYNFEVISSEEMRTESSRDVFECIYKPFMEEVPMFFSCNKALFRDICRHLHLAVYGPNDVICIKDLVGSGCDMHIVAQGRIGIRHPQTDELIEGHNVYGTASLFGLKKYPSSVEATDFSDIYTLNAVVFRDVIRNNQINVLQFEMDMMQRGEWTEDHPYLCKYDDWRPKGSGTYEEARTAASQELADAACQPRLGDWEAGYFDDLADAKSILNRSFASKSEEKEVLTLFERRQRAYIGKLLLSKRRSGSSEIAYVEPGQETDGDGCVIERAQTALKTAMLAGALTATAAERQNPSETAAD